MKRCFLFSFAFLLSLFWGFAEVADAQPRHRRHQQPSRVNEMNPAPAAVSGDQGIAPPAPQCPKMPWVQRYVSRIRNTSFLGSLFASNSTVRYDLFEITVRGAGSPNEVRSVAQQPFLTVETTLSGPSRIFTLKDPSQNTIATAQLAYYSSDRSSILNISDCTNEPLGAVRYRQVIQAGGQLENRIRLFSAQFDANTFDSQYQSILRAISYSLPQGLFPNTWAFSLSGGATLFEMFRTNGWGGPSWTVNAISSSADASVQNVSLTSVLSELDPRVMYFATAFMQWTYDDVESAVGRARQRARTGQSP